MGETDRKTETEIERWGETEMKRDRDGNRDRGKIDGERQRWGETEMGELEMEKDRRGDGNGDEEAETGR